jgi:hypothetical protein
MTELFISELCIIAKKQTYTIHINSSGYGRDVKSISPDDFDAILTTVLSAKNKRINVLNRTLIFIHLT